MCVAIALDALAYRKISSDLKVSTKGIVLSLLCGVGMGLFYPFVAKALTAENHLGPYTVALVFALGVLARTLPLNYIFMRKLISGPPLPLGDYFRGTGALHFWGVVGGMIWGVGTISNFAAPLHTDGRTLNLLHARTGRHYGLGYLGRVCVEGVWQRPSRCQAPLSFDVLFLPRGAGLCRLGPHLKPVGNADGSKTHCSRRERQPRSCLQR